MSTRTPNALDRLRERLTVGAVLDCVANTALPDRVGTTRTITATTRTRVTATWSRDDRIITMPLPTRVGDVEWLSADTVRWPLNTAGDTVTFRLVPATMTVRVRDRGRESPWGSGLTNPVVVSITISAHCPQCGQRRGEPSNLNQHDDGCWYSTDVWDNACGHTDPYTAVIAEAAELARQASS